MVVGPGSVVMYKDPVVIIEGLTREGKEEKKDVR